MATGTEVGFCITGLRLQLLCFLDSGLPRASARNLLVERGDSSVCGASLASKSWHAVVVDMALMLVVLRETSSEAPRGLDEGRKLLYNQSILILQELEECRRSYR